MRLQINHYDVGAGVPLREMPILTKKKCFLIKSRISFHNFCKKCGLKSAFLLLQHIKLTGTESNPLFFECLQHLAKTRSISKLNLSRIVML